MSMRFHVYNEYGEHLASCKYVTDAAALVSCVGGSIRIWSKNGPKASGGKVVWMEDVDGHASDSFDEVAEVIKSRVTVKDRVISYL